MWMDSYSGRKGKETARHAHPCTSNTMYGHSVPRTHSHTATFGHPMSQQLAVRVFVWHSLPCCHTAVRWVRRSTSTLLVWHSHTVHGWQTGYPLHACHRVRRPDRPDRPDLPRLSLLVLVLLLLPLLLLLLLVLLLLPQYRCICTHVISTLFSHACPLILDI
jgi:hypothetical protein